MMIQVSTLAVAISGSLFVIICSTCSMNGLVLAADADQIAWLLPHLNQGLGLGLTMTDPLISSVAAVGWQNQQRVRVRISG